MTRERPRIGDLVVYRLDGRPMVGLLAETWQTWPACIDDSITARVVESDDEFHDEFQSTGRAVPYACLRRPPQ